MISPLISIIIPVYNTGKYIAACIDSICNQTYHNWELILVDDGSTDNSPSLCDKYASQDLRIKVIHKPNGGLVSARNVGYDVASGEWMMYIDGDDWIDVETCEKLVKSINNYPDVDVVFWKYLQDLNGKPIIGKIEWQCNTKLRVYDDCVELARNVLIYSSGIATAYCKLIRTEYARQHDIKHASSLRQGSEGVEFSLRAFYYANKCLFLNEYLYHYRYNPNSISKIINEKNTQYLADCFDKMQEDIMLFKRQEEFQSALYQNVLYGLIAVAIGTYFHPNNKEYYNIRKEKFKTIINTHTIFIKSLKSGSTHGMDLKRRFTIFCIKHNILFMLDFIALIKQLLLKKGIFNY